MSAPHTPMPGSIPPGLSRRSLLAAAGGTGAALALAACGSSSGTKSGATTLSFYWWGDPVRAKITNQVLDLYHKQHPSVTFKKQWGAYDGYYDKLSTMVAGGGAPDIFQVDDDGLAEFASKGVCRDLRPYIPSVINLSQFPSGLAGAGVVNGKRAAIAAAENTPAMFYDRTVLGSTGLAAPATGMSWDDFVSWAAKITSKSGGKLFGATDGSGQFQVLEVWLRQHGKEFYQNGKLWVNTADMTNWFNFWLGARRANATPTPDVTVAGAGGSISKGLLAVKKGASEFQWSNQFKAASAATPDQLNLVAYPGPTGAEWARASLYWSVYSASPNAAAAAHVIGFLVNDVGAARILGAERGLAPNAKVRQQIQGTLSPADRASTQFEQALSPQFSATPPPPPPGHTVVRKTLQTISENVLFGRATAASAASQFIEQAGAAIGS
jgi:pectin-derived oligosaccharide transport system substrate-binding protein